VEKEIKVFCDSNIIFSAIYTDLTGSYPSLIIKLAEKGVFQIYFSHLVELEVKYNITKKIPEKVHIAKKIFKKFKKLKDVLLEIEILKNLTEKDRIILSTAIYYRMDFFITGKSGCFSHINLIPSQSPASTCHLNGMVGSIITGIFSFSINLNVPE